MGKRKARVVYNKFDDRFDIDIQQADGSWELSFGFKCQHSTTEPKRTQDANYISWEILEKIRDLKLYGYEIYLLGKWI